MEWVNSNARIPIKSWAKEIEESALQQAQNLANLPFSFKHIALMPDCHSGYGMPIGGVLATVGAVIPNAVGVDIGCGMGFIETDIDSCMIDKNALQSFIYRIKDKIPVGFKHHSKRQIWEGFEKKKFSSPPLLEELDSAKFQLGTLGGGNHFIEMQESAEGKICLMVHSGSRNFGYKIAKHYNALAQKLNKMWYSNIPSFKGEDGLAFLPLETSEAQEYIEAMNFALDFAYESRKRMMNEAIAALKGLTTSLEIKREVNIHHNFAALEHHYGKNVVVHRKGATQARKDQLGIIPGSMGTSSYIVRGLGNPESFESCSHGAGRVMSRSKANKILTLQNVKQKMGNILFDLGKDRRGNPDLSEAPQAYKDIDTVIASEKDLVETVLKLKPLAVVKG